MGQQQHITSETERPRFHAYISMKNSEKQRSSKVLNYYLLVGLFGMY